jgi:hypothetical protein
MVPGSLEVEFSNQLPSILPLNELNDEENCDRHARIGWDL